MAELLAVAGLTVVGFAATNIDNLILLVTWLITPNSRAEQVFAGYTLGMFGLLALCYVVALSAAFVPVEYLGFLGVVPVGLGIKKLWDLRRMKSEVSAVTRPTLGARSLVPTIALTQVGNGADTIVVFVPLLSDTMGGLDPLIALCFAAMVLIWFGTARFLALHARRLRMIERYGELVAPIVMIVIGLYILDNTATDMMPGH